MIHKKRTHTQTKTKKKRENSDLEIAGKDRKGTEW